jgi:hypothetical protein
MHPRIGGKISKEFSLQIICRYADHILSRSGCQDTKKFLVESIHLSWCLHWAEDDLNELNRYLDGIFGNLQCLPPSKPSDASKTVIWSMVSGKVQFLTNPLFYRIATVGGKVQDGRTKVRPQASSKQLQVRVQDAHGVARVSQPQLRPRQKSLKSRNRRKPPPRLDRTSNK